MRFDPSFADMKILLPALLLVAISCSSPQPNNQKEPLSADARYIPLSWVPDRVLSAENRLKSSTAGSRILDAINAHGGLQRWYDNGPIFFRFNYRPIGGRPRDTYQTIDTWSSRAVHWFADDSTKTYGFDGEKAWYMPDSTATVHNPRFWSMTPYYFVGIPFVFADEGVNFQQLEDSQYEGRTYDLVKVTFDAGTGDAPDDFYVIYIDKETSRVGAIRYIVSYPGFYDKGESSVEKFMNYIGEQSINGITLPTEIHTLIWENETPGEKTTHTEITDVRFYPDLPNGYFSMPEEGIIQESL